MNQDDDTKLSTSLLKLKIRNTTAYLSWRIAILKRDKFKCRICLVLKITNFKTIGTSC